jgi:hypothetical protein
MEKSKKEGEYNYYLDYCDESFSKDDNSITGIAAFWHTSSLDDEPNEELNEKLQGMFDKQGILTPIDDLIEIPYEQTEIRKKQTKSKLVEQGRKLLLDFEGDFSNQAIVIFNKLHPGNGENIFMGWLAMLSSVMGHPIIVVVKGDPGTGKTVMTEIIKESIPNDHIIEVNKATLSSLFGKANVLGPHYPDKKIYYLGDLGDKNALNNTLDYRNCLRKMASDGKDSRELSDTNKPTKGPRPVLEEFLYGYPTMIYSTVRDGEIEHQETDRAIELTPKLHKIKEIKDIIWFAEDEDAIITKELKALRNEWFPKFQAIFEYLIGNPKKVLLPWNLRDEKQKLRDLNSIRSLTIKMAMVNQVSRINIEDYILAGPTDLDRALRYIEDGELERTRLQQVYERYGEGADKDFTRDDIADMFPDVYSGPQRNSLYYRHIIKPATLQKDEHDIPVIEEIEGMGRTPNSYYFRREPEENKRKYPLPPEDYEQLKKQHPDLPWDDTL